MWQDDTCNFYKFWYNEIDHDEPYTSFPKDRNKDGVAIPQFVQVVWPVCHVSFVNIETQRPEDIFSPVFTPVML